VCTDRAGPYFRIYVLTEKAQALLLAILFNSRKSPTRQSPGLWILEAHPPGPLFFGRYQLWAQSALVCLLICHFFKSQLRIIRIIYELVILINFF